MKIAIIGSGFTGLTAGLRLAQKGHFVHIFEKEDSLGGLAAGFKNLGWNWSLEKTYHHWFTNDAIILNLAKELSCKVLVKKPQTDIFINNKILPLDSALSLLAFPYLSSFSRIRVGICLSYLKLINNYRMLENRPAIEWIKKWMGKEAASLIWDPLFSGKFGSYKNIISLSWFWARIKKRTTALAYPENGFKNFAEKIAKEIEKLGGKITFNTTVNLINSSNKVCTIKTLKSEFKFDKIICTTPSAVFASITPDLPQAFVKNINLIPHLDALNLVLILKKPFLKKTYWLNITDKSFPFLVLVEHTNFIDPANYDNQHIVYIGNYLPKGHPYFKMNGKQLLKQFDRYLLKLNPHYKKNLLATHKFIGPFAQSIVSLNHSTLIPKLQTPLKNIYLANLDMVYPWDRGTNYAVELGEKVAKYIQ